MNIKQLLISILIICFYSCDYFKKDKLTPIPVSDSIQLDSSFSKLESPLTAYITSDSLEIFKLAFCTQENKIGSVQFLDSVKIIAQLYNNEIDNQWSLIEYSDGTIKKQGFVKSIFLTNSILKSKSNPSFSYFIRKVDLKDTVNNLITAYLIEVENGKVKKSHFIDSFDQNMELELSSKTFTKFPIPHEEIIFVNNIADACGVESVEKIFVKQNNSLTLLFKNNGVSDADVYASSKDIYYILNHQFFPITYYDEPQAIDSIPDLIKPYLDSPKYLMVYDYEFEADYDTINDKEILDKDGIAIMKTNKEIYTFYSWKNNKLVKHKEYDFKPK